MCSSDWKLAVRRLIGAGAGVIFKGSGFYQTDYRSRSYQKAAENDKSPSSSKTPEKGAKDAEATKPSKKDSE